MKHEINENELCYLEDGYMYWFPCSEKGGLSASQLRQIADHLDSRNKDWDDGVKTILEIRDHKTIKESKYRTNPEC